jgi:hypothetical protein
MSWCCASVLLAVGRGLWRGDGSRRGRSTRGDKAERTPARCSMRRRLTEHARARARGTGQSRAHAQGSLRRDRGEYWRGYAAIGDGLCHKAMSMAVLGHPRKREGYGRLGLQGGGSRSAGRVLGRCSSLAKPEVRER